MNQRAELVAAIQKASTLQEQAALVSQLDAYDRQQRTAAADARATDFADTVIKETLSPVAVHERDTHETDWLGEITASAEDDPNEIVAEAALWYRRVSDEVKADADEFSEQARGMARRTASRYGEQADAMRRQFLEYVAFLRQREAASGLPQVEQLVDSQENPSQTPLPEDVFDNFAPPVHPINEGVSGTETSERNPMWQAVEQDNGQGQPEKPGGHTTAPEPYTYAEVPPQGPEQMTRRQSQRKQAGADDDEEGSRWCEDCGAIKDEHGMCPSCYPNSERGEDDPQYDPSDPDHRRASRQDNEYWDQPSVAISHVGTLDDYKAMFAREAEGPEPGYHVEEPSDRKNPEFTDDTGSETTEYGEQTQPYPSQTRNSARREAASGLPQVEQIVDSFENPDPKPLPQEVAFPWEMDEDDPQSGSERRTAVQRRAAYVMSLLQKDPDDLTGREVKEIRSFTASMRKRADQFTQPSQVPGAGVANNPGTTPERPEGTYQQGYSEGVSDWKGEEAPTFSDNSSHVPEFAQGHSVGYGDAARADEYARRGELPRGAGNPDYQTHAASKTAQAHDAPPGARPSGPVACANCGTEGRHYSMYARGNSKTGTVDYFCRNCGPEKRSSLQVSAAFTAPVEAEHPEFRKAYAYASRWAPGTPLVTTGSAEFEAGLYAGITDNPGEHQRWIDAHRHTAKRYEKPEFVRRMNLHHRFSRKVAQAMGLRVQGAYVVEAYGPAHSVWRCRKCDGRGQEKDLNGWDAGQCSECNGHGWGHYAGPGKIKGTADAWETARASNALYNGKPFVSKRKTAATSSDLDTLGPSTSPSPSGDTPINGPGSPGPLAGGSDPAAPGGPAPYNGVPPYGTPVVPNGTTPTGEPGYVDDRAGGPVDQAARQRLSPQTRGASRLNPQTHAFRRRVQASLLQSKQASLQQNGE